MRCHEVVAAAALRLVTCLIPFSAPCGPLPDLTGLEPWVRPGVGSPRSPRRTAPGRAPLRSQRAPGGEAPGPRLGDRAGLQVAGGTGRGPRGGGGAASAVVGPRGASPWRGPSGAGRVAVVASRPLGGPAVAEAGAGPPAARPRRFRFHPGCWLLFNVPTHVSVCLVNRSGRESQAAVLSPLGKAHILAARHMVRGLCEGSGGTNKQTPRTARASPPGAPGRSPAARRGAFPGRRRELQPATRPRGARGTRAPEMRRPPRR